MEGQLTGGRKDISRNGREQERVIGREYDQSPLYSYIKWSNPKCA